MIVCPVHRGLLILYHLSGIELCGMNSSDDGARKMYAHSLQPDIWREMHIPGLFMTVVDRLAPPPPRVH